MSWEDRAREVEEIYGGYVDWEERFFICPECDEPIYEDGWEEESFNTWLCPVCEFEEDFSKK